MQASFDAFEPLRISNYTDRQTPSRNTSPFKWAIYFPYSLLCNLHKRYHGESTFLKVLFHSLHLEAFQGPNYNEKDLFQKQPLLVNNGRD